MELTVFAMAWYDKFLSNLNVEFKMWKNAFSLHAIWN